MIRHATAADIDAIEQTYIELRAREKRVGSTTNWDENYPTRVVPEMAVPKGWAYVLEEGGVVRASMLLNGEQGPGYDEVAWNVEATDDEVLVIHTLVVPPTEARHGYGKQMLDFALEWGREHGKTTCRIDTWVGNAPARDFYARNGFAETGVIHVLHWGVIEEDQVLLDIKL